MIRVILVVLLLLYSYVSLSSQPNSWQIGLQEPATELMRMQAKSHTFVMLIMSIIFIFVALLLLYVMLRFRKNRVSKISKVTHSTALEIIWTVIPMIIALVLTFENVKLVGFRENIPKTDLILKVIGHQWYWSYHYPDYNGLSFDSYIKTNDALEKGDLRLLSVDNNVILPINTNIKLQVTASDVIHSWGVPSFGIKIDAVPGRLNESWFNITKAGTYYGQCYELCGQGHGFMPIVIQAVSKEDFDKWIEKKNKGI
ncbi:cytochrome c oxidase subunit II [Wolbachia endosymbiont of Pentidionis agamae]|uniref:cytochrome c oxidase subunit II n=1 Tax=Wolbachia endosymbiont of Pentidionis agamae TaxID=3110435 RepID=UPI002FD761B3